MLMRTVYIVSFIFMSTMISCQNGELQNEKSNIMKNDSDKKSKRMYMLVHSLGYPSEILVNGVIADIDLNSGVASPTMLNDYICTADSQRVQIRLFHPNLAKGGVFTNENTAIARSEAILYTFIKEGVDDVVDMKIVQKIEFPEISSPTPILEATAIFKSNLEVSLQGWSNSKDLSLIDENELKNKVLKKFEELRAMLNNGDGKSFVTELEFRNSEYFKANYYTTAEKTEYLENIEYNFGNHASRMPPIENFRMRLMGDNRVVALENLVYQRGQGVLTSNIHEENLLYQNYVMLHIPKGKDDLEIVRMNSWYTIAE